MLCSKCGIELSEGSKTCHKCGQALTPTAVSSGSSGTGTAATAPAPAAPAKPSKWGKALWLLIPGLVLLIWYARLAAKGYAPGASPQMFWVEFCCVLSAILIGVRRGGVALGLIGGLGVSLLVLGFRN